MSEAGQRGARRVDALSRQRIVEATVEVLDVDGEAGLTVRALSAHLSTGRGAIYHHVASKEAMVAAAADEVIAAVLSAPAGDEPVRAVRALALGVFDAIDAHPWVGGQLSRDPGQPAVFRIWSGIGLQLHRLGIPEATRPAAGAALVNYVLGAAAQFAAGPRKVRDAEERRKYLVQLSAEWAASDVHAAATDAALLLEEQDDREQFLAGVDIFLAGITTLRQPPGSADAAAPVVDRAPRGVTHAHSCSREDRTRPVA